MSTVVFDIHKNIQTGKLQATLPTTRLRGETAPTDDPVHVPVPHEVHGGWQCAPWGKDNMFPTRVRKKFEKVGIAGRIQHDLSKRLTGSGIIYFRRSDIMRNPTAVPRAHIPAVEEFLEASKLKSKFLYPQALDYRTHANMFSEGVFNRKGDYIARLWHKSAEFCRLEEENANTFKVENVIYSQDFSYGIIPIKERSARIPLVPWWDVNNFLRSTKSPRVMFHKHTGGGAAHYYTTPYWVGLVQDKGWLDVAANVPRIVDSMQRHQVVLTYQISIPDTYFQLRFSEWHSFTDEQRNAAIDSYLDQLDESLADTDNVYKSVSTIFKQDPTTGEAIGKVEITPLDDKTKRDHWLPSSNAANLEISYALGAHPSQLGLGQDNSALGGNSGSNQRELFNIENDTNTIEQLTMLEDFNAIACFNREKYNDWDIVAMIDTPRHVTKDKSETGREPSGQQEEDQEGADE